MEYGAKLPASVYQRPYFADQDFKRPRFDEDGNWIALNVVSVDGNYIHRKASQWGEFLYKRDKEVQSSMFASRPAIGWRSLRDVGLGGTHDGIYEAFKRSCIVMREAWEAAA